MENEKDLSAELIHQVASPLAGTEPSLTSLTPETLQYEIKRLRWALRQCDMMARRNLARATPVPDAWKHIRQWCGKVGVISETGLTSRSHDITIQEIARQAAIDAANSLPSWKHPIEPVADAVRVAVLQEVKHEVTTLLANTTTMETGWSLNDARWRSVFSELRLRVQALDAILDAHTATTGVRG